MESTTSRRGILWLSVPEQEFPVCPIFVNAARHLHVTLQFGVNENEIPEGILGEAFTVRFTENCFNSRVHALRAQLPEELRDICQNENPPYDDLYDSWGSPCRVKRDVAGSQSLRVSRL